MGSHPGGHISWILVDYETRWKHYYVVVAVGPDGESAAADSYSASN